MYVKKILYPARFFKSNKSVHYYGVKKDLKNYFIGNEQFFQYKQRFSECIIIIAFAIFLV